VRCYVVTHTWDDATGVVAVCLTRARADQVIAARRADPEYLGGHHDIAEIPVDAGDMLLQPVVMRHYFGPPEVLMYRDTEQLVRDHAEHLRGVEKGGAYYYAAVIVPMERT